MISYNLIIVSIWRRSSLKIANLYRHLTVILVANVGAALLFIVMMFKRLLRGRNVSFLSSFLVYIQGWTGRLKFHKMNHVFR